MLKELNNMQSDSISLRHVLTGALLLLCFYAMLSFYKSGEVLSTMAGKVQRCEVLGGASESRYHATIQAENGSYLIASLKSCSQGMEVRILIKRGALYFNTLYAAEETRRP